MKWMFDCYLNGQHFIILTTQDGKEYVCTSQGELVPMDEYKKIIPSAGTDRMMKKKALHVHFTTWETRRPHSNKGE